MCHWMTHEAKYDLYSHHYGKIRGDIFHQTLKDFKEFIKNHEANTIYHNKGKTLPGRKSIGRRQRFVDRVAIFVDTFFNVTCRIRVLILVVKAG